MVSELNGLRMAGLLEAVTRGWDTKTVPYSLESYYIRLCDPFEVLQAKVTCFLRRARVPSSAHLKQTILLAHRSDKGKLHVFYLGLVGEYL